MSREEEAGPSTLAAARRSAELRRKAKDGRFPISVRALREKCPNGKIVRASLIDAQGNEVVIEGPLDEHFFQVARAFYDIADRN